MEERADLPGNKGMILVHVMNRFLVPSAKKKLLLPIL